MCFWLLKNININLLFYTVDIYYTYYRYRRYYFPTPNTVAFEMPILSSTSREIVTACWLEVDMKEYPPQEEIVY